MTSAGILSAPPAALMILLGSRVQYLETNE